MKLMSEGIERHTSHNTFIIGLLIMYLMILGVQWKVICIKHTNSLFSIGKKQHIYIYKIVTS